MGIEVDNLFGHLFFRVYRASYQKQNIVNLYIYNRLLVVLYLDLWSILDGYGERNRLRVITSYLEIKVLVVPLPCSGR